MSLRMMEGFDHLGTSFTNISYKGWTYGGNLQSGTALNTPGRWAVGSYARLVTQDSFLRKIVDATGWSSVVTGFTTSGCDANNAVPWFYLVTPGGVSVCALSNAASGAVNLHNASGSVVATSATGLRDGGWHYWEVKAAVAGASGSVTVRYDGTAVIGPVTSNFGSTNAAGVYFGPYDAGGVWRSITLDDVYFLDTGGTINNDFLGVVRVETLYPNSDGASTAWTPLTAGHYDEVDEQNPDGDTTRITTGTTGNKDTFGFPDLSIVSGTINGVQTSTIAKKTDANSRSIGHVARQGGSDYDSSSTFSLTGSYAGQVYMWEKDPTGAAWTVANVNADEFGVKVTA